jgi:peptidyl-prolyl cis-trans isomerase A (cyclophilin A)
MKITRLILIFFLAITDVIPGSAQSIRDSVVVTMETEEGNLRVFLFTKEAPVTCANFLKYVEQLGDQGGEFYRTVTMANQPDKKVKIEVIQGGFNLKNMDTSTIKPIPLERTSITKLSHKDGTLSMARSDPDSGSTEFFICIGDQPSLDFGGQRNPDGQGFAAFGQVIQGMDVVRRIQAKPAAGQALTPPVRIVKIQLVDF